MNPRNIPCDTPYCDAEIPPGSTKKLIQGRYFCDKCRSEHSIRALIAQSDHGMPIKEVLLESSAFKSAGGMADYIGVSFVTVYNWIAKYYKMTFQEFRRQFICKKESRSKCYVLDIRRSSYSRHDYVLKKIRAKRYCACINILDDSLIMTNAPLAVVRDIIRGRPRIEKINDDLFSLAPDPVKEFEAKPVYFDQLSESNGTLNPKAIRTFQCDLCDFKSNSAAGLATHKRTAHKESGAPDPLFFEKLLIALYKLGGESDIDSLRKSIVTVKGEFPRKNNTRREVYRRPEWLRFSHWDDQVMQLTDEGVKHVENVLKEKYSRLFNE